MQVALLPRSSIAKKALMAVTGAVWIGYLALAHVGQSPHLPGAAEFNHYAEFLREVGEPVFSYAQLLWIIRIVIVFSLVAHMWSAWDLYQQARHARSQQLRGQARRAGQLRLALYAHRRRGDHPLRDLPPGAVTRGWRCRRRQFDPRPDPYRNVVIGFSNPIIVAVLPAGAGFAGPASFPRRVEHVPDPGLQQPPLRRLLPRPGGLCRARHSPSALPPCRWPSCLVF